MLAPKKGSQDSFQALGSVREATSFSLMAGQNPDLVKLNFVMKGSGVMCIWGIELLQTPPKR